MYQTNPRFQSETIHHPNLGTPQQLNPSPQQQQPTPSTEPSQGQPTPLGMSTQQTPPVGDLAAQLADLQARQSTLEAQQAQATQPSQQLGTASPTAQRVSPTMQPSAGNPPNLQAPRQPQQPQPMQQPQPQQPVQPQQGPMPAPQPSQVRALSGRLRSMMGVPIFGQPSPTGQQPTQPGQAQGGSPMQQPTMPQQGPQVQPQMQHQGQQGSPLQAQMGPQMGQPGQMSGQPGQRTIRQPPVDILDEGEDLVLEIELPGAKKEEIQLTGRHNAIQLDAPTRERGEEEKILQSERGRIHYQRSIPLGIEIDSEKIKAKFEDGILRVKAPKRDPTSGPQRINVK